MKKENQQFEYNLEFLEKAFSYLSCYKILEIDTNEMYNFSKKERQNLSKVKNIYLKTRLLKDYKNVTLKHYNNEEILNKANSFLIKIFPKYKNDILALDNLIVFDNISIYEAGLIYNLNKNNITFQKILIPNSSNNYTSSIIVHEKMHALTFQNIKLKHLFENNIELLPILLQKILLSDLNDEYSKILDYIYRINDIKQAFNHLEFMNYLKNKPNKIIYDNYVCEYLFLSTNSYIIGELYSDLLINNYLIDNDKMIKKLNQVLEQKLTIPEFLNSYKINLLNKQLIPTIKEENNKCKRISIIP